METQNRQKSFINAPHLLRACMANKLSETSRVHGPQLLDEYSRLLSLDSYLGPKRCWTGAARGGSDEYDRAREQSL